MSLKLPSMSMSVKDLSVAVGILSPGEMYESGNNILKAPEPWTVAACHALPVRVSTMISPETAYLPFCEVGGGSENPSEGIKTSNANSFRMSKYTPKTLERQGINGH